MADSVQLTDLDVIARYSLAVRSASADRDELIETLRADLTWLERGRTRTSTSYREPDAAEAGALDEEPDRRTVRATRAPAKKAATKKIAARRTPR